jgi:biotin carboxylase
MIGYNSGMVELFRDSQDYECYLLEEEEVYQSRKDTYHDAPLAGLRFGEYQQSVGFLDTALDWHRELGFDAVVAGLEYSVLAAEAFAAETGLRSPGWTAANAFTHKVRTRAACQRLPIRQPRFAAVSSAAEVAEFFRGTPIILKPANRQASLGVVRIDGVDQIEDAWHECSTADEGTRLVSRPLTWDFIVEDYLDGRQVSVESLVADGVPIFSNPTLASTFGNGSYAEIGHVVPGPLTADDLQAVTEAATALLVGVQARDGVFHSEWKLTEEGPFLLECAARPPGDLLPQLIEKAYGFNFYQAQLDILLGNRPALPERASRVAGVRFFRPPAGTFQQLKGIERLAQESQVFDYFVNMKEGEPVPTLRNSFSRAGYFAVSCDSLAELDSVVERLTAELEFVVSPVGG